MSKNGIEIAFITVNYNSAPHVESLLSDLLDQQSADYNLAAVVADNSPSESELNSVRIAYKHAAAVRFLRAPSNLGYFGAAHHALNTCFPSLPDWVIVSNADIRLTQNDLLARVAQLSTSASVIAPRVICTAHGVDQNPFLLQRPRSIRMQVNRIIPRIRPLYRLREWQYGVRRSLRGRLSAGRSLNSSIPQKIYAPHGSFIIFSKRYFERGGSLDVGAFLYAEEIFVAETCLKLGLDVSYHPALRVEHNEHVSTSRNPAVPRYKAAAADYIYREFYGREKC